MMTMKRVVIIMILLCSVIALAQQAGDELVTVPKKYVSQEGIQHVSTPTSATPVENVSQWVGIGKEVGIATKEGLNAVVDVTERFGATKVGTFVMVMIAWKIMAKDVIGIVLGVPLLLGGLGVWFWALKRFFIGYRVLAKTDGKVKEYMDHPPYQFKSGDARSGLAWAFGLSIALWVGLMVFAVIF